MVRVRELAQRIDEQAGKRTSMAAAVAAAEQQVRASGPATAATASDRRRLTTSATPYDFTMNESQRDWTIHASYSDYQALAKLLGRFPGSNASSV